MALGACNSQSSSGVNAGIADVETDTRVEVISTPEGRTQTSPPSQIVTFEGFKDIKFGMTESEVIAHSNDKLARPKYLSTPEAWEDEKNCYYLELPGIAFMIYQGTLERIDIWGPDIATDDGAKIGLTATAIETIYPDIHHKPNFYTHPIQDLIWDIDSQTKIIFEQDEAGVISRFRIGKMPAIEFVEGCL